MNSPTFPRIKPSNYLLNKIFTLFIHAKSKNNRFPLIFNFVTVRNTKGYKHPCKRCPFTLQKGVFYTSKGHLLPRKRAPFAMQKTIYYCVIRNMFANYGGSTSTNLLKISFVSYCLSISYK